MPGASIEDRQVRGQVVQGRRYAVGRQISRGRTDAHALMRNSVGGQARPVAERTTAHHEVEPVFPRIDLPVADVEIEYEP